MTETPEPTTKSRRAYSPVTTIGIALVVSAAAITPGHAARTGGAVAAALILHALATRKRLTRLDGMALAFIGWVTFTRMLSPDTAYGPILHTDLIACALIFIAIRMVVFTRGQVMFIIATYSATCLYMTFNLVVESSGTSFKTVERATYEGLNANHVAYAFAVAILLLACVASGLLTRNPRLRLLAIATAGVIFYFGILATNTRGAIVAAALTAIAFPLSRFLRSTPVKYIGPVVLGGAALLSTGVFDRLLNQEFARSDREDGALNGRLDMWPKAVQAIADHPVKGLGPGGGFEMNDGLAMHNAVLDVAVDFGMVGLVLWLMVILQATRASQTSGSTTGFAAVAVTSTLAPILLSGYWYSTPAAWAAFALVSTFSRFSTLAEGAPQPDEPTSDALPESMLPPPRPSGARALDAPGTP